MQPSVTLRQTVLNEKACLAPSQLRRSRDLAEPGAQSEGGSAARRGCRYTCLIAVLPIRTLHALKAARGLPLDDALPGPWQAVSAAVGERHLEGGDHNSEGLQLGVSLPAPLTCVRGRSWAPAPLWQTQAQSRQRKGQWSVFLLSLKGTNAYGKGQAHTHRHTNTSQWNSRKINCWESTQ